jgi:hypothetical protein
LDSHPIPEESAVFHERYIESAVAGVGERRSGVAPKNTAEHFRVPHTDRHTFYTSGKVASTDENRELRLRGIDGQIEASECAISERDAAVQFDASLTCKSCYKSHSLEVHAREITRILAFSVRVVCTVNCKVLIGNTEDWTACCCHRIHNQVHENWHLVPGALDDLEASFTLALSER